jgi:hypothetical protein
MKTYSVKVKGKRHAHGRLARATELAPCGPGYDKPGYANTSLGATRDRNLSRAKRRVFLAMHRLITSCQASDGAVVMSETSPAMAVVV